MCKLKTLFRQKYQSIRLALSPLVRRGVAQIGPNEIAMGASIASIAWGLAWIYLPLCPLFCGMSLLCISVVNSRMK